jgi:hypothetical protein
MNYKIASLSTVLVIGILFSTSAQSLDEVYSSWAEKEIPVSYGQIRTMVEKVYGQDATRTRPIIELHCKALNAILMEVQAGKIDINILAQALEKWSQSKEAQRVEQWWEWPDTNWMRVQTEYKTLVSK